MRVDGCQDPQLLAQGQLVVDKIHRPHIVRPNGFRTIVAQLGFHTPLRCLIPQLQAECSVNIIDRLDANAPALALQNNLYAAITIPHARFANLLDPSFQLCRIGAAGFIMVARAVEPQGPTRPAERDRPICAHSTNQFTRPFRLKSFRRTTSCNI